MNQPAIGDLVVTNNEVGIIVKITKPAIFQSWSTASYSIYWSRIERTGVYSEDFVENYRLNDTKASVYPSPSKRVKG